MANLELTKIFKDQKNHLKLENNDFSPATRWQIDNKKS